MCTLTMMFIFNIFDRGEKEQGCKSYETHKSKGEVSQEEVRNKTGEIRRKSQQSRKKIMRTRKINYGWLHQTSSNTACNQLK